MANITILGAGAMGSAFTFPCIDRGHVVSLVGTHLEDNFIDSIKKQNNFHPTLKINIPNKVRLSKFENFANVVSEKQDLIVLGINSKGIDWASREISKNLNYAVPFLMLTKGLSVFKNKYELLVDKMEKLLLRNGYKDANISAVGGPCLASGLAHRVHSNVIFANKNIDVVYWLNNLLSTNYYHTSGTDDIIGVEVCAAIKNIFSMIIGASEGLCSNQISNEFKKINYLNTSASILRQSIHEMEIFTESLKGKKETVIGLAGLGDLFVSASGGRNSKMGKFIGYGMTYKEAKKNKMPNETVEGAQLAFDIGPKLKNDFFNYNFITFYFRY